MKNEKKEGEIAELSFSSSSNDPPDYSDNFSTYSSDFSDSYCSCSEFELSTNHINEEFSNSLVQTPNLEKSDKNDAILDNQSRNISTKGKKYTKKSHKKLTVQKSTKNQSKPPKILNPEEEYLSKKNKPYPHRQGSEPSSFLDRYQVQPKKVLFNSITYLVERHHFWSSGVKRKRFVLKKKGSESEILASAEFEGAMSKIITVSNSLGSLCQIETNPNGPYVMRIGNQPFLIIALSPSKNVTVHFEKFDTVEEEEEENPILPDLINIGNARTNPKETFGGRKCMQSIKNVKLCTSQGEEFISVRKVGKNLVEVDAQNKVHFLACFAVSMFMYMFRK